MLRRALFLFCLSSLTWAVACTETATNPGGTGGVGGFGGGNEACSNGTQDPGETGVDCGGSCSGCPDGTACERPADCETGICSQGTCGDPACDDGRRNGGESDVDCGGSCGVENPDRRCAQDKACTAGSDCLSGVCAGGTCRAESCGDLTKNHKETGVDCGGGECDGCAAGEKCTQDSDCGDQRCIDGICVRGVCNDTIQNQDETDVDCGGSSCTPCAVNADCKAPGDCASGSCINETCRAASCTDGVKNQGESDLDCGGPCSPCDDGDDCVWNRDCKSSSCDGGACQEPSCTDGITNGGETGPDCGGLECGKCGVGLGCKVGDDCTSQVCTGGFCAAPSCSDGKKNQDETDVDCGGKTCRGCFADLACNFNADCWSKTCVNQGTSTPCGVGQTCVCTQARCDDKLLNADESDTDCGGTTSGCTRCANTFRCNFNIDCSSGWCNPDSKRCAPVRCGDGYTQPGEECDDGDDINDNACSNECKKWRCGDGITQGAADYASIDFNSPQPPNPFTGAKLYVCSAGGGASCSGRTCDPSGTGTATEHGICQSLGYPRALYVEWNSSTGQNSTTMSHAYNWSCANFICGKGRSGTNRDCWQAIMLGKLKCGGEECDEGTDNSNTKADACRTNCRAPRCGDGVKDSNEECDLGGANGGAACSTTCKVP